MIQTVLQTAGIAVIGVTASLILKDTYRPFALFCTLCASLIVVAASISSGMEGVVGEILDFCEENGFFEYSQTLLKALGIAYIVTITEELCKQAGENFLAGAVELAGKVELMILSLPLLSSLLDIAKKVLQL